MKKRTILYPLACFLLLSAAAGRQVHAQACATTQRLQSTNFFSVPPGNGLPTVPAAMTIPGWIGSGAGIVNAENNRTYFFDDINTQTFTQAVTNVNLKGDGVAVTLVLNIANGTPGGGNLSNLNIVYNGVTYGSVTSSNGTGTTAAVTYTNGATGNLTTIPIGFIQVTWTINLPTSVPNNANLVLRFVPTGAVGVASDDYNIFSTSMLSCPITYSGTIYNDNNGMTDGQINGTGFNPGGLQVGLFDASGNLVPGTATNVNADGTYSLSFIGTGNYTVRLIQATIPAGFGSTGETTGNQSGSDGAANGSTTSITIANASNNTNKSGNNFGLSALPATTNDLLSNQTAGAVATIPNILSNDTDPNGTLSADSISLVVPSGATGIVTDAQGDVTGFTVPGQGTWSLNSTTGAVTFTPQSGFTGDPTPISYTVTGAAGLVGNPATITMDYAVPLSVSLISFKGKDNGNCSVTLTWETAAEEQFRHFEIEVSTDGINYTNANVVAAKGNNSNYTFTYNNATAGINYFRLKMVDIDQRYEYCQVEKVNASCKSSRSIKVFPTVTGNTINISGIRAGEQIMVYDVTGRTLLNTKANTTNEQIDLSNFAYGTYNIIVVTLEKENINFKVVRK